MILALSISYVCAVLYTFETNIEIEKKVDPSCCNMCNQIKTLPLFYSALIRLASSCFQNQAEEGNAPWLALFVFAFPI